MCRFLLVHSQEPLDTSSLLISFAQMCEASSARHGEWQGDGWGMAWVTESGQWLCHKSLNPVWEDVGAFNSGDAPPTRVFAVHARNASFAKDRRDLAFNQPFVDAGRAAPAQCAFVFNGLLRGVALPRRVPGAIGAQRIWNLLREEMAARPAMQAMAIVTDLLAAHTLVIVACNIGLIDAQRIYASCRYSRPGDYYQLRWHASSAPSGLRMVCSEALPGYDFSLVPSGEVFVL